MSKGRIAILEDDEALARALSEAFTREGYEVFASGRSDEIDDYLKTHRVRTLFVDCLLPGGSGVDFVSEIRGTFDPDQLDVILMSGLLTDSTFVKDSLRATRAITFLKKPFDLSEAVDLIKSKEVRDTSQVASPRKTLYQLFSRSKVGAREKRKAIEALDEIHAFDLPYLYSLLAETKSSGHLNIVNDDGEVSGISFSQGNIVAVDITDRETYLGKILIEGGFITPEDLDSVLSVMSPKRLGERLINENLLSPHAFQIALANQMSIRLSRSIVDASAKINFVSTEVELTTPHIDKEHLTIFIHDWIASKISSDWLKTFYMQWSDHSLEKSAMFSIESSVLRLPLISSFPGIVEFLTSGKKLSSLLDEHKFPEDTTLKALHLLLTKGQVIFSHKTAFASDEERLTFLKKIWSRFEGKNKLEIIDITTQITGFHDSAPESIISEFQRMLGAEPSVEQEEILFYYKKIMDTIAQALQFAKVGNREKLKEEIAKSEIEMKIKAASLFEEAKEDLQKSLYSKALVNLQKAASIDPKIERIKLYLAWAKLGVNTKEQNKQAVLKEVEMDLLQVAPEDKFDAIYSFVLGLFYKNKGDFGMARKSLEKSINLDNSFIVARRELNMLMNSQAAKNQSKDLKDIVTGFFKRR